MLVTLTLRGLTLTALVFLAAARAAAGEPAAPLVIVGGTVIDGTGRPPLPDGVIVIRDGKFASVTSAGTGSPPADARRIDAGAKWIIPGLIDMHVHYHEWMDEPLLRHGVKTLRCRHHMYIVPT